MFGGLCGPIGLTGWLVMGVVWTGVTAVVVWAIARLFPERPPPAPPADGGGATSPRMAETEADARRL